MHLFFRVLSNQEAGTTSAVEFSSDLGLRDVKGLTDGEWNRDVSGFGVCLGLFMCCGLA